MRKTFNEYAEYAENACKEYAENVWAYFAQNGKGEEKIRAVLLGYGSGMLTEFTFAAAGNGDAAYAALCAGTVVGLNAYINHKGAKIRAKNNLTL